MPIIHLKIVQTIYILQSITLLITFFPINGGSPSQDRQYFYSIEKQQGMQDNFQNSDSQSLDNQIPLNTNSDLQRVFTLSNQSSLSKNNCDIVEDLEVAKYSSRQPRRYCNHRTKTTVGFQRSSWEQAVKNKRNRVVRYYQGQQVSFMVDLEHFKMYGPGIELFFKFLKQLTILFFCMTLISLIPITYNAIQGTLLTNAAGTYQVYIALISVGNQQGVKLQTTGFAVTQGQISDSTFNKLFIAIPDVIYSLLFLAFYFYWCWKSQISTMETKEQIKLINYQTIELIEFNEEASEQNIRDYMEQFGKVIQIAPVKNYQQMIYLAKQMYTLSLELKQLRLLGLEQIQRATFHEKEEKIKELQEMLRLQQDKLQGGVIKYYIVFETPVVRELVLETFRPYQSFRSKVPCLREQMPPQLLLKEQQVRVVSCNQQPSGILWQNVHITWRQRWWRQLVQVLVLLLVIVVAFLWISLLNVSSPPMYNTSLDTSTYGEANILNAQRQVQQTWCLKNIDIVFADMSVTQLCSRIQNQYYIRVVLISTGISLAIMVVRFFTRKIVVKLAMFKRYSGRSRQSNSVILNLFFCYVCTTVLITILVIMLVIQLQTYAFGISFKRFLGIFVPQSYVYIHENIDSLPEYSDFTGGWYVDIGYQIWLNWLVLAFSPHCYWPLISYGLQKVGVLMGKRQLLQKNMENWIEAEQFDIEDHYANILMVVWVGFAYSGGIPILLPLSFVALATKYISHKYCFIRFSRIPKAIDESLNDQMIKIMPFCLWSHFAVSLWMYGVSDLFAYKPTWIDQTIYAVDTPHLYSALLQIMNKVFNSWWYFLIWVICMAIVLFKTLVYDFIIKMVVQDREKAPSKLMQKCKTHNKILQDRSRTNSYKLENNPDYFQIVAVLNPRQLDSKLKKYQSVLKNSEGNNHSSSFDY